MGLLRSEPVRDPSAERLAGLIKQLGDNRFAQREAASQELQALGEKALPALRRAAELRGEMVSRDVFSETDYRQYTYKRSILTPDGWKLIRTLEGRTRGGPRRLAPPYLPASVMSVFLFAPT